MGMFDYIHCKYPLQSCPQALIDRWGKSVGDIAFQTKDTPDQGMTSYVISEDGELFVECKEYEWIDTPEKAEEGETPMQAWANRGYNKVTREWQVRCDHFNGSIIFYEGYAHADKKTGDDYEQDKYADGWVEYEALFQNGQLIQIEQSEHTLPIKYSEQEIVDRRLARAEARREQGERNHTYRHEHPNAEQRLIDNINEIIVSDQPVFGIEDLAIKLSQIQTLIKQYREKYDWWYAKPE